MSQRCLEQTSVLRAPIGGRLHRTQTDSVLFYCTFAVPLSSGASRQEEVDRRETGGTIKVASARISVERACFYALACTDPLGAPGGCDGDASHALCQKRRRSHSLPGFWQRAD